MLKVYFDGGSRGNPGPAAIGYAVYDEHGNEIAREGKAIGRGTNNYAEYRALIEALRWLLRHSADGREKAPQRTELYSDSELLVHQMNNRYRVKSPRLIPLFEEARRLMRELGYVELKHVRREENRVTDWIVNRVLDKKDY